jgi:integrase/recombinase XerD
LALQTEVGSSETYRIDTIGKMKQMAQFHHPKSFRDMTRQDIIEFLERLRKPEAVDSLHQGIGSYENNRIILLRFFKWLHHPDLEAAKRPKPAVMENIPRRRRREISIYKPTDLWTRAKPFFELKKQGRVCDDGSCCQTRPCAQTDVYMDIHSLFAATAVFSGVRS